MRADRLWENAKGLISAGDFPLCVHSAPEINRMAVAVVNIVYSDLCFVLGNEFKGIESLEEYVALPDSVLSSVFIYGLCMHIAAILGDNEKHNYFAQLYNSKRLTLTRLETICDIFSKGGNV